MSWGWSCLGAAWEPRRDLVYIFHPTNRGWQRRLVRRPYWDIRKVIRWSGRQGEIAYVGDGRQGDIVDVRNCHVIDVRDGHVIDVGNSLPPHRRERKHDPAREHHLESRAAVHEMLDLKPQYEVWCLIPNQRRWQRWGSVFQPLAQAKFNANYSNFYLKLVARAAARRI